MKNHEAARKEYRRIRERSEATSPQAFDAAVKALVTAKHEGAATPEQWLAAAKVARFCCKRCAGTGMFITFVENGQPKGPGGICYRCEGRGTQSDADVRRNYGADLHYMARAV